jgi:NAD+ diphosphatase
VNLVFHEQSLVLTATPTNGYIFPDSVALSQLELVISQIPYSEASMLAALTDITTLKRESGLELVPLRQALPYLSEEELAKVVYAQQLMYYQQTNRFCASCGSPTVVNLSAKWLSCPGCNCEIYPRISPAIIVAVTRGNQLLMTQSHHFAPTMWSVLAGFCEIGESLEQTVVREVQEEVGIAVTNIRYFGSQYWPFPNTMMVAFTAEYAGGEIVVDHSELRAAGFFTKQEIPGRPSTNLSIASRLIDDFIART